MTRQSWLSRQKAYWRSHRQRAELCRRYPQLSQPLPRAIDEQLAREHAFYVANVSSPDMAASLETARMLWQLCEATQPERLLDTGSGFSSYILRTWAADQPGAVVWSVDDDARWLERTEAFLTSRGLSTDNLTTWGRFAANKIADFDLVFHDLGSMPTRQRTLPQVLSRVAPRTGVLVLDDMHKPQYESAAIAELYRRDALFFDARAWTHDAFQRRATVVCDLPETTERLAA